MISPLERKIEYFKLLLSQKSFYNAAESDWRRETQKRNICAEEVKVMARELRELGVDPLEILKSSNYLVEESELGLETI